MGHEELARYNKVQRFLIQRFINNELGTVDDWIVMNSFKFRQRWEMKHAYCHRS